MNEVVALVMEGGLGPATVAVVTVGFLSVGVAIIATAILCCAARAPRTP